MGKADTRIPLLRLFGLEEGIACIGCKAHSADALFTAGAIWRYSFMQEQRPNHDYWNGLTDYGPGHEGEPGYAPVPEEFRSNGMSKACMICGFLSLVAILLGLSFPIGALGLLFGFLSRDRIFSRQAKTGMILSGAGMAAFVLMLAVTIFMFVSTGLWDYAVERVREVDPSDPVSVAMAEQDIMNKVLEHYGLSSDQNPYSSLFPGAGKRDDTAAAGISESRDPESNAGTSDAPAAEGTSDSPAAADSTSLPAEQNRRADSGSDSNESDTGGLTYGSHDGNGDLFA